MVNQDGTGRHRIFCLMGKSGTGKDTIYRELLSDGALPFERLVPCTTRPIRAGEQNGREYHFYSVEEFRALERAGKVIESRCYETVHGPWYYFTADDGQIDLASRSTLMIGTLESYLALRAYYGADKVVPVYLEVEDGERLQRALDRERAEKAPKYRELCRRFLADCEDFSGMRKFSDIIGQKAIIEHLYNALRTGSISHAYILSGDAGSGRKTIASIFAAALQCEDLQEEETEEPDQPASRMRKRKLLEPCGRCLSCIQSESGNQPDIITISHEKPNSIGVGEIRRMRADLQIKPYSNARKVYIIPDAEKLTIPAQNVGGAAGICGHYFDREWAVRFFADDTEQVRRAADPGGGGGADRELSAA